MRHRGTYTDELNHFAQIELFVHGEFRIFTRYLTTIPGYHAIVAAILWITGADSLNAARLVNAAFALIGIAGFHALRRRLWPGTETLATAQLIVLPILAPLFFLVYTDVFALALLVWATFATVTARHWLSAALLVVLIDVRQNEVVWAGLLAALAIWPLWRERGVQAWREILANALPYCVPVAAFLAFWGGTDRFRCRASSPRCIRISACTPAISSSRSSSPARCCRCRPSRDFAISPITRDAGRGCSRFRSLLFAAFWWGFHADNPYNTVFPNYYVRNALLIAIDAQPALRALVGAVVVLAACGLAFTRLRPAGAYWLYPIATLFLAASWLIEQRYALVPLVLWLAFREHRGRAIEWATAALWLALAVFLFQGMFAMRFFL